MSVPVGDGRHKKCCNAVSNAAFIIQFNYEILDFGDRGSTKPTSLLNRYLYRRGKLVGLQDTAKTYRATFELVDD